MIMLNDLVAHIIYRLISPDGQETFFVDLYSALKAADKKGYEAFSIIKEEFFYRQKNGEIVVKEEMLNYYLSSGEEYSIR